MTINGRVQTNFWSVYLAKWVADPFLPSKSRSPLIDTKLKLEQATMCIGEGLNIGTCEQPFKSSALIDVMSKLYYSNRKSITEYLHSNIDSYEENQIILESNYSL